MEVGADVTPAVNASSIMCPYSDHLPLILVPRVIQRFGRRKRFLFDNMWLREDRCREIITQSWGRTVGHDTLFRIESCAEDIWRWGRGYNKDFQRKIENCKARLELHCCLISLFRTLIRRLVNLRSLAAESRRDLRSSCSSSTLTSIESVSRGIMGDRSKNGIERMKWKERK
nr:uncharacterized protein LOC109162272 [Ipomoea batatas]